MDRAVEKHLGDEILYKRAGLDAQFVERRGFLIFPEPTDGLPMGDGGGNPQLKISKTMVARPTINDRVQAAQLEGTWRPIQPKNGRWGTAGRDWVLDLQRATS